MKITRFGEEPTVAGPAEYFTGTVRIATTDPNDRYAGGSNLHSTIIYEEYTITGIVVVPPAEKDSARVLVRNALVAMDWGASERMVVSPGHEENGIFQMPTGQSGHPLSPYYNRGHLHWVNGTRSPFLPGESRWTLAFLPGGS